WTVTLTGGGAVGRVSLVDVNTKRVFGEFTMPSGLMRSFIVPPEAAGQDTTSVYYDGFLDTCFLYDQAVALVAFLTTGEQAASASKRPRRSWSTRFSRCKARTAASRSVQARRRFTTAVLPASSASARWPGFATRCCSAINRSSSPGSRRPRQTPQRRASTTS